jgi:ribonuclease R
MSTINDNKILKQEILNIVSKQNKRPIPIGILFSKITKQNSNKKHHNFNDFRSLIDGMITNGELKKTFSGAVVLGYENAPIDENNIKEGTIKINNKKIGFISLPNNRKSEYYVHTMNLNNAQDGDIVKFAPLLKDKQKNLKDAKVIEVIRHGKNFFVGIIKFDQNRNYQITLDDDRNYLIIKLNNTNGLVTGHKILIEIQKYEKDIGYGYVKKIIGHTSDVGVDILSIVYDNGVEPDFSEELLNETNNIKLDINSEERKIRKDLTNLNIFTIDPKTSKDFDDAIYVEKHEDIYKLYVSIADVSHYVSFNSVLDQEAYKRGCSIYLVDRVIPMLPHNLSDDICSLNPNVERLTLTCEMDINHNGEFKDIKIYPSIIKSKRRFNYDEVNEFFDKKNTFEKDTNEIKDCLLTALELHKILNVYRKKQGYIEFEIPEPVILVNEKCEPVKIDKRTSGTAQKLIENCMVAANEAVTIYAIKHKLPFVYRVHDKPNEERIKSFAIEAKKLNFHINTKIEDIEPKTISN